METQSIDRRKQCKAYDDELNFEHMYRLPLSSGRLYHVTFVYHPSALPWVRETATKLECKKLRCYFEDRDGLPGQTKPSIDENGSFYKTSMNIVIVFNNYFVKDPRYIKLLRRLTIVSLDDASLNLRPVQIEECIIPEILNDTIILQVVEDDPSWLPRLFKAIQLAKVNQNNNIELEVQAKCLIELLNNASLEEILGLVITATAEDIIACLFQGTRMQLEPNFAVLASGKNIMNFAFFHPSDQEIVYNKMVYQHQIETMEMETREKENIQSLTNKSAEFNRYSWNQALNIIVGLSSNLMRDRKYEKQLQRIIDTLDEDENARIILLKLDDCKVPNCLKNLICTEISDEDFVRKCTDAIASSSSNRFKLNQNDNTKTNEGLETFSKILKTSTYEQLSQFLSSPEAVSLRSFFSRYTYLECWLNAMKTSGITFTEHIVIIDIEKLLECLQLGHNVGKYYSYLQYMHRNENFVLSASLSTPKGWASSNTILTIKSYKNLPVSSFVVGVGLLYALELHPHKYSKNYVDSIMKTWNKGIECKSEKHNIAFWKSTKINPKHGTLKPMNDSFQNANLTLPKHYFEILNVRKYVEDPTKLDSCSDLLFDRVHNFQAPSLPIKINFISRHKADILVKDRVEKNELYIRDKIFEYFDQNEIAFDNSLHLEILEKGIVTIMKELDSIPKDSEFQLHSINNDITLLQAYASALKDGTNSNTFQISEIVQNYPSMIQFLQDCLKSKAEELQEAAKKKLSVKTSSTERVPESSREPSHLT